jgi:muconolactone delta-isomerase
MQFLSISHRRPDFSGTPSAEMRAEEVEKARALYAAGLIRQLWHREDTAGACILWEAESREQVWTILQTLPFTRAGLVDVTVIPLSPWAGFGPAEPVGQARATRT